jgi:subtilase family serine protease
MFHDTFFASLPNPNFNEIYPLGNPPFSNTVDAGLSGPTAAALWSGEATLDIEWSYATAPGAHIILVGVPPAETEGVQGFPTLFNAMQGLVNTLPPGTVFSQSFGVTEQTFGGAAATQTAKLDAVYQSGIAKGDTFLASAGDFGTTNISKLAKETVTYPFPTVIWPTTSPWVTSAGGTQLQSGWVWTPTSNVPFNADGTLNSAYFAWAPTANSTETVWNESWAPIATGGNASAIYARPSWQSSQASVIGKDARGVPDLAWNSAVNGGVLTWISAYPSFNCGNTTGCWAIFGGTSAASPQLSGVVALANQLRGSKGPVGWLNPRLYLLGDAAGSSTPTFNGNGDFRDIVPQTYGIFTLDNNQLWHYNADGSVSPGPIAGNPTLTGWDMTTGFGSPRANTLVHDLANQP